jgi:hypothetical protein
MSLYARPQNARQEYQGRRCEETVQVFAVVGTCPMPIPAGGAFEVYLLVKRPPAE